MRKILSVLLVLCMLMTLAPAAAITSFAEEALEIPVIEEVSEDELVEIYGEEEVELYGTVSQVDVPDTAGYTLISGLSGASVSATGTGLDGNIASLINGKYTTGTWGGANNDENAVWYKDGNNVVEGFMGWTISKQKNHTASSIVVDLGSEQTFSGLRIYDSVRARSIQEATGGARKAKYVDINISADGIDWTAFDRIERTDFSDGVYDYLLKKTDAVNAKARYIKVRVDQDNTAWGQFEFEEIVLINKNDALTTTVEPELFRDYYDQSSYFAVATMDPNGGDWNPIVNLFDGRWQPEDQPSEANGGNDNNFWHSKTGLTPETRGVAITFAEAQKIGGFRIYPRVDNKGGNPRYITVFASTDGTNFDKIIDHAFVMNNTTATPVEVHVQTGVAYEALKFQVDENASGATNNHTSFCELQVLKPKKGYAFEEDVIQFTTTPAVTSAGSTTDTLGRDTSHMDANSGLFDKVVYQFINEEDGYYNLWTGNPSGDPHFEMNHRALATDGNTAWAVIDLGKEYTFSAARVFGRWNQPGQGITEAILYVSDTGTGTDWVALDKHSDTGKNVNETFDATIVKNDKGEATTGVANGRYNSTGDIYTDVATKYDGTAYNVTARYIKLEAVKTSGAHWSMQELLLVKPVEANETKTVSELKELSEVEEVLDDYYTNPGDWTWTAREWQDCVVDRLFDGTVYGNQDKCWHSPANMGSDYVYTEEDKTVTIMFDKPTEVGGVRLFPRTVSGGASPNVIKMQGTCDKGETWVDILPETTLGFTSGKEEYKEAYLYHGRNNTFDGIKVISAKNIDTETTNYTCFTELQVLKPVAPKVALGADEVIMTYPIGTTRAYGVKADSTVTDLTSTYGNLGKGILIDGVILDNAYYQEIGGTDGAGRAFQVCFDWCIGGYKGGMEAGYNYKSSYVTYDLGHVETFSGVRLYGRVNSSAYFTKGIVYVSEDGKNWIPADTFSVASARSTTLPVKFAGTAYNVKARYIGVECTATNSGHWGLEEIRLLNPVSGNETKTPSEITVALAAQAEAVETLIAAIGTPITMESKAAIDAAREAYGALSPAVQALVDNYDVLTAAEAAWLALAGEELNDMIAELPASEVTTDDADAVAELREIYEALSDTDKATINIADLEKAEAALAGLVRSIDPTNNASGKLGYATLEYKLYTAANDVTVTGITYNGETVTNDADEWKAVTNGDGTITLTLGGNYYKSAEHKIWLYSSTQNSITSHNNGGAYYKFKTGIPELGIAAGDELTENTFNGFFVREITNDGPGKHVVTVSLSDGTTKEIVLNANYTWKAVNGALAAADADGIAPNGWQVTANGGASLAHVADRWFNGSYADKDETNSQSWIAQYYDNTGADKGTQHFARAVGPYSTWVDFGAPTKFAGVRVTDLKYSMSDVSLYGSNDLVTWEKLGSISGNNSNVAQVNLEDNANYRYARVDIDNYQNMNNHNFMFIKEIVFIVASTRIVGGDINVDLSDEIEDVERRFNSDNTYAVTSVKVGDDTLGADTDYVLDTTKGITFKKEFIETLEIGEYEAEVSFESGETATVKIIVKDLSVAEYWLTSGADYNGTGTLTLTNATGKTVKSVAVGTTSVEFAQTPTEITILRCHFKPAADVFAKLSADQNVGYEQPVTVTFEDNTTKNYTVKIFAEWYQVSSDVTTTYLADEVATGLTWKVRNNASQPDLHPVNTFVKAAYNKQHAQNYHGAYSSVNGVTTPDLKNHYIDVDMGTDVKEIGGIRYQSRFNSADWPAVTISGSDDYATWTTLYTGKAAGAAGAYVMKFDQNSAFRYIRINITGANYPTADTIHFLKPALTITGETVFKKDINATDEEIEVSLEDLGDETIAKVVLGTITLAASEYVYDAETDTVLIKAEALNKITTEGDTTLAIETSTSKVGAITVKYMDFSKKLFPQEVTPYHFEHEVYAIKGTTSEGGTAMTSASDRKITTKSDGTELKNTDYAHTALTHSPYVHVFSTNGSSANWNSAPGAYEIDYKIPHKFSAVRVYHRIWADGGVRQYFTSMREGYIEVSNDGIHWLKSDVQTFGAGNLDSLGYNRNAYDDIKFIVDGTPMNIEARYVRVYPTKNGAWQPIGVEEICLYEPQNTNAELTAATITPAEPVYSLATMDDLVLDVEWNDYITLDSISLVVEDELVPIASGYYFCDDSTITLSKYFFIDGGYNAGDEFEIAIIFAVGSPVRVTVKVADAEEYTVNYSAGENGTLKAVVRSTDMATGEAVEKEVASGSLVGRHENLVFVAEGNEGYEAGEWTLTGKSEDTVTYEKVTDFKNWKFGAINAMEPVTKAFDGDVNTYWHSEYDVKYNPATGKNDLTIPKVDINEETYWITAMFDEPMMISELSHTCRLKSDGTAYGGYGQSVKDYKIWSLNAEGERDVLLAEGAFTKASPTQTVALADAGMINGIELEILSLYGAHCSIAEIGFTEKIITEHRLSGDITYTGSASQEYEIDNLFADATVSVEFAPIASGTAKITTDLKRLDAEIAETKVPYGENAELTLTPDEGEELPDGITVTMDGLGLKEGQDYTYDSATGEVVVKNVKGDIKVLAVAKGVAVYTVTYKDEHGATGTLPEAGLYTEGDTFELPKNTLKLAGSSFDGWALVINGEVVLDDDDEPVIYDAGDTFTMPAEDVVFTAVWEGKDSEGDDEGTTRPSYGGGGNGGGSNGTGLIGGGIGTGATTQFTITQVGIGTFKAAAGTIIAAATAPEGQEFVGWYLDEAFTVPYANTGVIEDIAIYPYFRKIRSASELTDIQGHWAEATIGEMYVAYLVNGKAEGIFDPNSNITRAEFCQILYLMSGQTSDGSESFDDVNVGDWFTQAVAWAVNNGITMGTTESTFSPYENITREQMATMIYRYATLMGLDWTISAETEFADRADFAEYANYQINWAADKGIVKGYPDGTFGPKANATRAEAVSMLQRLLNLQ